MNELKGKTKANVTEANGTDFVSLRILALNKFLFLPCKTDVEAVTKIQTTVPSLETEHCFLSTEFLLQLASLPM